MRVLNESGRVPIKLWDGVGVTSAHLRHPASHPA
jgi:hypothetical protein